MKQEEVTEGRWMKGRVEEEGLAELELQFLDFIPSQLSSVFSINFQ